MKQKISLILLCFFAIIQADYTGIVDLTNSSFEKTAFYGSGDQVYIQVNDPDLDTTGNIDTVMIQLQSASELTWENVKLIETGTSTDIFHGSIVLDVGNTPSADGLLQVNFGDSIVASYDDEKDDYGSAITTTTKAIFANTVVDSINTTTHWTISGSPYLITQDITIPTNDTLYVYPGVEVRFLVDPQDRTQLNAYGVIIADGTVDSAITFTSNSYTPNKADWQGIQLYNQNQNLLNYCNIEYTLYGIEIKTELDTNSIINHSIIRNASSHGIYLKSNTSLNIKNSIIDSCSGSGIFGEWRNMPNIVIQNTLIRHNNSSGIYLRPSYVNCEVIITNDSITGNNQEGIYLGIFYGGANLTGTIKHNFIANNNYNGLSFVASETDNESTPLVDSNIITENGYNGIVCEAYAFPVISNNTITNHINNPGIALRFNEQYWTESKYSISYNTITGNQYGIYLEYWSRIAAQYNGLYDNISSDVHNNTSNPQDCRYNYWGPEATDSMNIGGNPKQISGIYDYYDDNARGEVNYANWMLSAGDNVPPSFISLPVTTSAKDSLYHYQVYVTDYNNDPITFSLVTNPDGMTINSSTGLVEWTPDSSGDYNVTVASTDTASATSYQNYTLSVFTKTYTGILELVDGSGNSAFNYKTSDTVYVKVTDPDMNNSSNVVDQVEVKLTSATETTPEVLTLHETNISTGIFTGFILFDTLGSPTQDGELEIKFSEQLHVEYTDSTDDNGYLNILEDDATLGNIWSGTLNENTIWENSENPYFIQGNFSIASGATLTINPGVEIRFLEEQSSMMSVYGNLAAEGTSSDSIIFTSAASTPSTTDWRGIYIHNASHSSFRYCAFRYAETPIRFYDLTSSWSAQIKHCLLEKASSYAVHYSINTVSSPDTTLEIVIDSSLIIGNDNNTAIHLSTSSYKTSGFPKFKIHHSTLQNWSQVFTVYNSYMSGYSVGSLYITISDNTINNCANGFTFSNPSNDNGYFRIAGNDIQVLNQAFQITVSMPTLIIANNTISGENSSTGIYLTGSLDSISLNTINGFQNGISCSNNSTVIYRNNFIDCNYGLYNQTQDNINAQFNFWGVSATNEMNSGGNPKNISAIFDKFDNSYQGEVNYSGWLASENAEPPTIATSARIYLEKSNTRDDASAFSISDTIFAVITDDDENANSGAIDVIEATFTSTTESSGEKLTFLETDINSGEFRAFILSDHINAATTDGVLQIKSGEEITFSYVDTTDDYGNQITLTQTAMFGNIWSERLDSNTIWTKAESPYIINQYLQIETGITLTIEPGVTVKFIENDGGQISVYGTLNAIGTSSDSIIFTSAAQTPAVGDWNTIYIYNNSNTRFNHCAFRYGNNAINYSNLQTPWSSEIKNCRIEKLSSYGIYYTTHNYTDPDTSLELIIDSTLFIANNSSTAVYLGSSYDYQSMQTGKFVKFRLSNCTFDGWSQVFSLTNNYMPSYSVGPLYMNITNNHFIQCTNGFTFSSPSDDKGYLNISGNDFIVSNQAFSISTKLPILKITNNVITGTKGDGIYLNGTIDSLSSNSFSGFDNAIRYLNGNTPIYRNDLSGCTYGLYNSSSQDVDAKFNFWGESTTTQMNESANPKNISVIYDDFDDESRGQVNYSGWLATAGAEPPAIKTTANVTLVNTNSIPTSTFAIGDTVFAIITDSDRDKNSGAIDEIQATFSSTTETSGETVTFLETGSNTGTFIVSILTDNMGSANTDGILQIQSGEEVTLTYVDSTNDYGNQATLTTKAIYGNIWTGNLSSNTTWTKTGSPYLVYQTLTIPSGLTLSIEPGATITFLSDNSSQITVDGTLEAMGTPSDSITFTSAAASPSAGDWNGIVIHNYSQTNFVYCAFRYANIALLFRNLQSSWSSEIKHCLIENSAKFGVCYSTNNYLTPDSSLKLIIDSSLFVGTGNDTAVYLVSSFDYQYMQYGKFSPFQLSNCNLQNWKTAFTVSGFDMNQFPGGSGEVKFSVENNTITNCNTGFAFSSYSGTSGYLNILNNNIQVTNQGFYLAKSFPVLLISGNTLTGPGSDGNGIYLSATLDSISLNTITGFQNAINFYSSDAVIYRNNLYNCTYGIYNNASGKYEVDARFNFWGESATSEMNTGENPKNISVIYDWYDNYMYGKVNYAGWLSTADAEPPAVSNTNANIWFNAATYTLSDSIYLTVSDDDQNTDKNNLDYIQVNISSQTEPNGETVTLTETGSSSGQFVGSVASDAIGTASTDGIIQVRSGESLYLSYIDQTNEYGNTDTLTTEALIGNIWSGTLKGNTTWTKSLSPYLVFGTLTVPDSFSLTIEPGVTIKFAKGEGSGMTIYGTLNATGTTTDSITFTSISDAPSPGDWNEIQAVFNTNTRLEYCNIQYASSALSITDLEDSWSILVRHTTISNTSSPAIQYSSSRSTPNPSLEVIIDSSFFSGTNNKNNALQWSGFMGASANVKFLHNTVTGWQRAVNIGPHYYSYPLQVTISGNLVTNCQEGVNISNNYFENSAAIAIINNNSFTVTSSGISLQETNFPTKIFGNTFSGPDINSGNAINANAEIDTIKDNSFSNFYVAINLETGPATVRGNSFENVSIAIDNKISKSVDARYNYWGTTATTEMEEGTNPKDISILTDYYDDSYRGEVNYAGWLDSAGATPPTISNTSADISLVAIGKSDTVETVFYSLGDTIYVEVYDPDGNTASDAINQIEVSFTSTVETSGEKIFINETGLNSNVFFGYIVTEVNGSATADGILQIVSGENVGASYLDSANDYGTQSLIKASATIGNIWTGVSDSNTVWTKSQSPYLVQGVLIIPHVHSLTIEPGVVVKFIPETNAGISVWPSASLNAMGNSTDSIKFISSATEPSAGNWQGIKSLGGTINFKYIVIHHAVDAVTINMNNSLPSMLIRHSLFKDNSSHALAFRGKTASQDSANALIIDSSLFIGQYTHNAFQFSGQGSNLPRTIIANNTFSAWQTAISMTDVYSDSRSYFLNVKIIHNTITSCNDGIQLNNFTG
ncbi:MAG: right-handed parallel beta-helix repeat-containing protein, partial [Fibrobacteria bacterium]|nr:right-handed parallel beta-helix repeat-containing protein [Fibrobacteria bacterium]